MRDLGNKSFKLANYHQALKQYTQAVRYAPYPITEEFKSCDSLSLALANRSAALYSLTRYKLCLLDIDLALKYNYPEATKFKLYIRRIKCLHVLSVWANDLEQMKSYLRTLADKPDTKEFIKTEINNMFDFIDSTKPCDVDKEDLDISDENTYKICNINRSLGQASDCVEMNYDAGKGRYLMTNKDVSYGRVLIAEDPFVSNLAPMKRDNYCYNCFGHLYSCGIGCLNCSQVLYCSENCLELNSQIHQFECRKFLPLQNYLGVSYIVAHIMFKINFELDEFPIQVKKTTTMKKIDDLLNIPLSDWPDLDYKSNYPSLLSLMDHSESFDYDAIMGYTLTAVYMMTAFVDKFQDRIANLKTLKAQLLTGSIVLKHLTQLQSNLISILHQDLKGLTSIGHSLSGVKEKPIGVGLYPTVSLLNHACNPNVISIFSRNRFVVRAGKSLECGVELNYCYGPHVNRMSKKDRQKRLQDQYFFTCKCYCCSENIENKSRCLLCPKCKGPVVYNYDMSNECMKCHKKNVLDSRSYLMMIDKLKKTLEIINSLLINDNTTANKCEINCDDTKVSKIRERMLKVQNIELELAKYAFGHNPLFVQIKTNLIESADLINDMQLAAKFSQQELELCDEIYGDQSYESIMTKLKLINYKWRHLVQIYEKSKYGYDREEIEDDMKCLTDLIIETRAQLRDLLTATNILGAESSYDVELKFLNDVQNSIQEYLTKPSSSQQV